MGRKNCQILILCLILFACSCVKDTPSGYVVCEGSYGYGNASLYDWLPAKDSVYGDLFKAANNGMALGDIFQSMTRIGNNLFLCVNNSDKVVVIDAVSYKQIGSITIPKPRYLLDIGNGAAYVTSLFDKNVYRINTQSLQITDTIALSAHNTEGICLLNSSVYVCCWDTATRFITQLDAATGSIQRQMRVAGFAPQEVLVDKDQMLWVLSGNSPDGKAAAFTRLDPSTGAILDSFIFPLTANPVRPVFNAAKDTLYFIEANYSGTSDNNGIYRMSIYSQKLPDRPFISAGQYSYFWALGIDPVDGSIYAGDPKGFSQSGWVNIYHPNGTKTDSFKVGIGPGHFYFDY